MDVNFDVIHINSLLETIPVSYSDTFKRQQIHQLESGICGERNWPYFVVFRKFAYSLMSRVIAFPNSIVTAIVNSDAYH